MTIKEQRSLFDERRLARIHSDKSDIGDSLITIVNWLDNISRRGILTPGAEHNLEAAKVRLRNVVATLA